MTSVRELIETVAKLLGSESKLASACGVSQNALWQAEEQGAVALVVPPLLLFAVFLLRCGTLDARAQSGWQGTC
jgi:hypothetical protein